MILDKFPTRILHVIVSMDPRNGGPSQGIRNLDKVMHDKGIIREVVCLDAPDSSFLGDDGFKIHAIGPFHGAWRYSAKLIPWLYANIERFDVVIINGLWIYHSYATWRVIDSLKKTSPGKKLPRVLVMAHGMLDPYFQRTPERWLKAIRNWVYWKVIESKVVNDADGLLFTCQAELLLARDTFRPYHPKKEYNAGYGIKQPPVLTTEMSDAFYNKCPDVRGVPYLLFLSRIHPKKGIGLLIKAYISLYQTVISVGGSMPYMVIAGPGWDSTYGKMLKQQLADAVTVRVTSIFAVEMLTNEAKWGAFYGCEAFVLPSHQENFGIAVVEALACSKPTLISNQVNIWREIESEGGGIVENDDEMGTYRMLKKWLKMTADDKFQMGKRAKTAYQNHFRVNKIVENYVAAFTDK
jgi:glycosyltransferase involved in cell wall biosynthesis